MASKMKPGCRLAQSTKPISDSFSCKTKNVIESAVLIGTRFQTPLTNTTPDVCAIRTPCF